MEARPPSIRLIAFNLRGYSGSSPFNDEDKASGPSIMNRMGRDVVEFVNYTVQQLNALSVKGSSLVLMSWSFGAASIIAAFGLSQCQHDRGDHLDWISFVKGVVIYEAPSDLVFGLTRSDDLAVRPPLPPPSMFARLVSGFYQYPSGFFDEDAIIHTGKVYTATRYLTDDPGFWSKSCVNSLEPGPDEIHRAARFAECNEKSHEHVCSALEMLARLPIEWIICVATMHGPSRCMEGCKWLRKHMANLAPDKFIAGFVPGDYNHFIHNVAPEVLWKKLLSLQAACERKIESAIAEKEDFGHQNVLKDVISNVVL